jgi:pyruvate dehydrogenase E2 component (dihydrolipoamide acetyltransferase)
MATKVIMPSQGQSAEPVTLLGWKRTEGDRVTAGEVLCEVESDKATFEVEAPASGVLLKRLYSDGDLVPLLSTIGFIGESGEEPDREDGKQTSDVTPPNPSVTAQPTRKLRISPRARRLAEKEGVEISRVTGSGSGGRIVERDIRAAMTTPDSAAQKPLPPRQGEEAVREIPVSGIRKIIADRMAESLSSTAQLTLHSSADASAILSYRKQLKASPEETGLSSITINDLILFAVSRILPRYPRLNSRFLGDRIAEHAGVHLGMAVDTERGLMVPVIEAAQTLTLRELSAKAAELRRDCTAGMITPDALQGGTFTVTNLGPLGVELFTPVLNIPEVAILGVGNIQPKPVMVDDRVRFVPHLGLSLTVNHQAVDGAPAASFLQSLAAGLARFELLLAE